MDFDYCYLFVIIFCICDITNSDDKSIECRDEFGKAVDWYVMYKIPKIRQNSDPSIRRGTKYLYITSKTISDGWKLSNKEITSSESLPGRTLETLYRDDVASDILFIMYNDQGPNKKANSRFGHAKGIVMTNETHGIWLMHSVPQYPPIPRSGFQNSRRNTTNSTLSLQQSVDAINEKSDQLQGEYNYPSSGTHFGQSFLCISLTSDQMNTVGLQLMHNQVISYRYNLPEVLSKQFPNLVKASKKIKTKNLTNNHIVFIQSRENNKFISFAKSSKWNKDLYDDFIAPTLQIDLLTETWLNGPEKLPSDCHSSKVLNVQSIILDTAHVYFNSTRDHSKWAVSLNNSNDRNWVCIGDINRAHTQFDRGGGAVCLNSLNLWNNYRNAVSEIESCPKLHKMKNIESWFLSAVKSEN